MSGSQPSDRLSVAVYHQRGPLNIQKFSGLGSSGTVSSEPAAAGAKERRAVARIASRLSAVSPTARFCALPAALVMPRIVARTPFVIRRIWDIGPSDGLRPTADKAHPNCAGLSTIGGALGDPVRQVNRVGREYRVVASHGRTTPISSTVPL